MAGHPWTSTGQGGVGKERVLTGPGRDGGTEVSGEEIPEYEEPRP